MKHYILDSHALIAYVEEEPGADEVERIIESAIRREANIGMSVINWGEFFYICCRKFGFENARQAIEFYGGLPITRYPADESFSLLAGSYKATNAISYADAFAAAAAKLHSAILVTGDPEFKGLEKEFQIHWLPAKPKTKKIKK